MKYSDKYPNAQPQEMIDATILCTSKTDNCYQCGCLTHFMDTDFEAFICSEECEEALTSDFFKNVIHKK